MKRNWWIIAGYALASVLFVITSVFVILFASGYKIDWQTRTLQKTGFLLVETYPNNAEVSVAGKIIKKLSPVTIKRLLPGKYLTEINKEGYLPWQANLTIKPGLVTEQRNTLLTFAELDPELLLESPSKLLTISPNESRLAIATLENEIILWNVKNQTGVTVSDPSLVIQRLTETVKTDIANGKITKMVFGPDNKTLLVTIQGKYYPYYLFLDTDSGKLNLITYGRNLDRFQWYSATEVLFTANNKLYSRSITGEENVLITEEIIDYAIYENSIYLIITDEFNHHSLVKINKNRPEDEPQIEIDDMPVAEQYRLLKINNNWALITESHQVKSLWLKGINSTGEPIWDKLASNIVSEVIFKDDYIIYQSGNKLMLLDADQNEELTPEIILNNQPELEFIHFGFDTLLYMDSGKLKSVDITGSNNYHLLDTVQDTQIAAINPQMSQLIYINSSTNNIELIKLRDKINSFINLSRLNLST